MAAPDDSYLKNLIASNLPDNGTPRGIKPAIIRATLNSLIDWVKTGINSTVSTWNKLGTGDFSTNTGDDVYRTGKVIVGRTSDDNSGAKLQASTASFTTTNGLAVNRDFAIGPAGAAPFRYFKVAQHLASSSYLRDILHIRAVMGLFGSANRGTLEVLLGNRDGFNYQYTSQGDVVGCGIAAYNQGGIITVYLKVQNDFRCGSITLLHNTQVTVFDSFVEDVPDQTKLVFDSTDGNTYKPAYNLDYSNFLINRNVTVNGWLHAGGSNTPGFKLNGVRNGSNLSLKTGRYVELQFEDGTTIKLAEVN
jgi:hypothetical protein